MSFYSTYEEQLSRKHPLYILAGRLDWHLFYEAFRDMYSPDNGWPAKPVRLMVSLIKKGYSKTANKTQKAADQISVG